MVQCDACRKWLHPRCMGLTRYRSALPCSVWVCACVRARVCVRACTRVCRPPGLPTGPTFGGRQGFGMGGPGPGRPAGTLRDQVPRCAVWHARRGGDGKTRGKGRDYGQQRSGDCFWAVGSNCTGDLGVGGRGCKITRPIPNAYASGLWKCRPTSGSYRLHEWTGYGCPTRRFGPASPSPAPRLPTSFRLFHCPPIPSSVLFLIL